MRFFLDQDVDVAVAGVLRKLGHEVWTAADAGLSRAGDDELTVYAHDKRAVLLTHDREFSARRRQHVVGWHVQLRCIEMEAADLIGRHCADIVDLVAAFDDLFIAMSKEGLELSRRWG